MTPRSTPRPPTRRTARPTLALAASLLALLTLVAAACGSSDSGSGASGSSSTTAGGDTGIDGRDWVLRADGTSFTVPEGAEITLLVDGTQASGSSGCNSYSSTVEVDGSDITFGTVASTMMACEDTAITEAEAAYTAALADIETWAVDGETLVLEGGDTTLTYEALPPVPGPSDEVLAGAWDITSIRTGSGETAAISTPIAGTTPTLTFDEDGTYTVVPACNTAGGDWTLDGADLTLTAPGSTMMACPEPEGADAQEATILGLLPQVASVQVDRASGSTAAGSEAGALVLLDADGNLLLALTRES